ncbi:MAG: SdrD B-like domain-containing protein, partial [Methanothrix sp.]|nr:SdrD B-like domain-containing protein [Methanothrix sp.]
MLSNLVMSLILEKFVVLVLFLLMIFLSCASSEELEINSGSLSSPGPLVLPSAIASDVNASGRAITATIETAAGIMGHADKGSIPNNSDLLTGVVNPGFLAAPTAKLSISGMVFNDLNGDGLRTNDEPVLPGWETILTQDGKEILRTAADNEGRYSFQNLASGQYTVVVINQSGWNLTHPTSGRYEINLVEINATNYDFGVHLGPVTFVQSEYPLMPMELAFSDAEAFKMAPKFEIKPETQTMLKEAAVEQFSLLGNLQYTASERTQYSCGNCWVWAGTACIENALTVQKGVKDRLSAQYFVSNYNGGTGSWACCGKTATEFANYYANTLKKAIPWTNTNADWRDSYQGCSDSTTTPAGTIGTTPNYPITSITAQGIDTVGVGEANAIANIKAALLQNKMVHFAFWLPSSDGWTQFSNFWNGNSGIYNPDGYCGQSASAGANGHAVACVGWDDSSSDPNQHYWIMLNSWGAPSAHPDGTFKVKMHMNYDCLYPSWTYAHRFWTYDVVFGAIPSTWTRLG